MRHIGIIMDGNGRWAENLNKPRLFGHQEGARALCRMVEDLQNTDVEIATFYAFSTENERRDSNEVRGIFDVINHFLREEVLQLMRKYDLKVRFIGNLRRLSHNLCETVSILNSESLNNKGKQIVFAIGYGGDEEVCAAVDIILKKRAFLGDYSPVTKKELYDSLYTVGLPLPDAVVRYGGYRRTSNFLPMQTIYSEYFFLDKLWPDYEKVDLDQILEDFARIKRNFGGVHA